jgi:hypothetical protein
MYVVCTKYPSKAEHRKDLEGKSKMIKEIDKRVARTKYQS